MAFSSTRRRYASFNTVQSLPGSLIDFFWYLIDNNLQGTVALSSVLNFELLDSDGTLSIRFSQEGMPEFSAVFDTDFSFNPEWPRLFHAIDNMGRETIITAHEIV